MLCIVQKGFQSRESWPGKGGLWFYCEKWVVYRHLKLGGLQQGLQQSGKQRLWIKGTQLPIAPEITTCHLELCNWWGTRSHPVPNVNSFNSTVRACRKKSTTTTMGVWYFAKLCKFSFAESCWSSIYPRNNERWYHSWTQVDFHLNNGCQLWVNHTFCWDHHYLKTMHNNNEPDKLVFQK